MKIQKTLTIADVVQDHVVIHFVPAHIRNQSDVERVAAEIDEVADSYAFKMMVLNFSRVKSMTSAFLGKIVRLNNALKARKIALRACSMNGAVEECFKLVKLQKLVPLFKSEKEAIR